MRPITFDIKQMVKLRILGWSYSALAKKFKKDHTTIIYHCQRLGVKTKQQLEQEQMDTIDGLFIREGFPEEIELPPPKVAHKYAHLLEEKLNPGKRYQDYLADALKRPVEKRYHDIYNTNHRGPTHVPHGIALATVLEEEARSLGNAESVGVV